MLTQWFQPEPSFKGLPFARKLRELGHEVEVLTGFPNYPGGAIYPGYRNRIFQREIMDGIVVNRVPLYPSHDGSGIRRIVNYLSFGVSAAIIGPWLTKRPDVIYAYNLITLGWAAGLLRMLHKSKVVLDVQDLWPESVVSSGMMHNKALRQVLRFWCQNAYCKPDHLTVLSPGFKNNLVEKGVPADKIDVIYNWCDESSLVLNSSDYPVELEPSFAGHFNVVFAGTMGKMQALDAVLIAAERIQTISPRVLFTFVGGGVEIERLKSFTSSHGLTNVQFLPRRKMTEMASLFAQADALLVHLKRDPLFKITIPSKIQAYMHAGRPIIAGIEGDAAELILKAGAGLVCKPEDPDSIAEAVIRLANMPAHELFAYGERAQKFYSSELSMNAGVKKFELLFRSLEGNK